MVSEQIRNESALKRPKIHLFLHNNDYILIKLREGLKCISISKAMLFVLLKLKRFLSSGFLARRHLQKKQTQTIHKNGNKLD